MLKSKDIIISIYVHDGPLSESEVRIMTSSLFDDVITHCHPYFDLYCIEEVFKSPDIIIFLYVFDGALQESAVIIQLYIDAKYRGQDLKAKIL